MNKKMMIAGIACALLLATVAFAAGPGKTGTQSAAPADAAPAAADTPAADVAAGPDALPEMSEEATPYSIGIQAVVTDILRDGELVSLEVKPENAETLILHISDATILLDNQEAVPVPVEDIKAGDTIYAYHDIMMTMSIPAQTPALMILTNLGDGAIARLHMPESVAVSDGTFSALCDNGSIWVRSSEETVFSPYRTRQYVTAADVRMGQPFVAWYDMVMESDPAQAVADRIVILPADFEERDLSLVLDGDMVIDAKLADGTAVVPARLTAETLGLTVGYRKLPDGRGAVTVSDGTAELSMIIGEYEYGVKTPDGTAAESFGVAPYTASYMDGPDVTWMSAEAFRLLGYDVSLRHETLSIEKR